MIWQKLKMNDKKEHYLREAVFCYLSALLIKADN